jgi:hypothetical protein
MSSDTLHFIIGIVVAGGIIGIVVCQGHPVGCLLGPIGLFVLILIFAMICTILAVFGVHIYGN